MNINELLETHKQEIGMQVTMAELVVTLLQDEGLEVTSADLLDAMAGQGVQFQPSETIKDTSVTLVSAAYMSNILEKIEDN